MAEKTGVGVAVVAALFALWILPPVLFPHPGTNDAIWLADVELPILLACFAGVAIAMVRSRGEARATVGFALSALMAGCAFGLAGGLFAFANTSNDRFGVLVFLPALLVPSSLVTLLAGAVVRPANRRTRLTAAAFGLAAAAVVDVWILMRGARDWLLAPYGLDVVAVMVVAGVALVILRPRADG